MPKASWTPIPLTPLSGMLDTRSRPAEVAAGAFRFKLNFAINRTGALCTRSGFAALNFGLRSDTPSAVANWDRHRRGKARQPDNLLFESTGTDGSRRLFAANRDTISVLNNSTSEWLDIGSGYSSEHHWKAAELSDKVVFVNQSPGGVLHHTLGSGGISNLFTWTGASAVTTAKVAITFADVMLLMNITMGGAQPSRIRWSDYKSATDFTIGGASVGGFQDLDYGDEILAAAEMMGSLYIFTTRSIWRCVVNITADTIFSFQKIYSEPKNLTGCLAYPNTLVTTGRELYWLGRDSVWTFNPYIAAPESPEWLLKGSGAFYSDDNPDRLEKRCCEAVIGQYHPDSREIWFSYARGSDLAVPICVNDRCLVLNTEYHTMDIVDKGFSALANFRKPASAVEDCKATQTFIGASGSDYCLKSIGGVFWRENVTLVGSDKSTDVPDAVYSVTQAGYYCRFVGAFPFGYPQQEKTIRSLQIDHDTKPNALTNPNLITLSIGNSFNLDDPMSNDANCSVQWHPQESLPLACPDAITTRGGLAAQTIAKMTADNLRPSDPTAWTLYEVGNRLYFDFRITSADGSAPKQHDSAWSALRSEVLLGN